jgi:phosphoribosylformimino-5-aminoimidazole carboxamide ribotide isomerase
MNLYPAIDILGGRAVRLRQGRREDATVYGTPVEMARRWVQCGARWLHIVDLDGAFEGRPVNTRSITRIRSECRDVGIEIGGGIRDLQAVEQLIEVGVDRVILGTSAVNDPEMLALAIERFGERIAVGIDARDGIVRLSGWTATAGLTALELGSRLESVGVGLIIYTDISRDGELVGVNVDATRVMLESTALRVIASGGVSNSDDILKLRELENPRLEGVIIGKALYEGKIDLEETLALTHAR